MKTSTPTLDFMQGRVYGRDMTTHRFAVISTAPFVSTFRTVRTERAARRWVRFYTCIGFTDRFGTALAFDSAAI